MGTCFRKDTNNNTSSVAKDIQNQNKTNDSNSKRIVDQNFVADGRIEDSYVIGRELGR